MAGHANGRTIGAALAITLLATPTTHALAAETAAAPGFPAGPQAPRGAPNVLIIMTDDVGFGAASTFGGPIPTPTFDALAAAGARYNRFHTTAICSPTRASLLTGRNPHTVGSGLVPEMATGYPGYNSVIPASAAMVPRVLQMNGYATAMFGKHHNTPQWEETPAGPAARKPNGFGFDYFYGFIGGGTNQFAPALYENLNPVEPPADDPDYILDRDLADRAISWLRMQGAQAPGKPFFLYYAPGTLHAPIQAPKAWVERFRGKFDQGWDQLRQEIYARQKRLGVIPPDAALAVPAPDAKPWTALSPDERRLAARYMEAYAAALAYCDYQIGRVIDELKRTGQLQNTLVIYIQGDNGGDAAGGDLGGYSYLNSLNQLPEDAGANLARLDQIGGPESYPALPAGWARATNAPFPWNKGVASHLGGIRNGMVISWPGRVGHPEKVRGQFHHLVDVAPTIYEAVGIIPPATVDGVAQQPLDGVSMAYSFGDASAPSPRREQYFEMFGSRGLYSDGWFLSSRLTTSDAWELYDLSKDYSQAKDVAGRNPERVRTMKARFEELAAQNNVNPISSDRVNRLADGGRPGVVDRPGLHRFYADATRYPDGAFADIRNRSWSLEAEVNVPAAGGDGMIVTQGGRFAGWGLRVQSGRPEFIYRVNDRDDGVLKLSAPTPLAAGRHKLGVTFRYDGGGIGKGGRFVLTVDGEGVAEARLDRTVGLLWGEDASVGRDTGTPLVADYRLPFAYGGEIINVNIDTR